ncbi:hypothetical protein STRTUCAR8_08640 [Streptomyces turgidiscabies Car8]|uniref:GIY-YIG nuclease family protein n=1 Tax=Streptomyces turgidiscabies (strain Car8) TaxID=698760 RepID=L7FG66_STRT8|nr:hypothetical protein [Streptomyces turgidiscabies]ELP70051.1 hypothetical protein STRTUCAR8_08640 [Streptomyces turgidiscabies Car8]
MSSIIPFTFPETGQPFTLPAFDCEPIIKGLEGHLYVVEFDSGGVKVGFTSDPEARITTHRRAARNFGRRAVRGALTPPHVEARKNEQMLIAACRKAASVPDLHTGEYFPLDLDLAMGLISGLPQTRGDREAYESEMKARSGRLVGFFKSTLPQPPPASFGPVFPWAKHMDASAVDEFVRDLRDALEAPDPLAAVDHAAFEWFGNVVADLQSEMNAAIQGGAR